MHQEVKEWMRLTNLEIKKLEDLDKKNKFLKMRKDYLKRIIIPLLKNLPLHSGFKFSSNDENLSCITMFNDLFREYQKRNYSNDDIWNIIQGKRVRKR